MGVFGRDELVGLLQGKVSKSGVRGVTSESRFP